PGFKHDGARSVRGEETIQAGENSVGIGETFVRGGDGRLSLSRRRNGRQASRLTPQLGRLPVEGRGRRGAEMEDFGDQLPGQLDSAFRDVDITGPLREFLEQAKRLFDVLKAVVGKNFFPSVLFAIEALRKSRGRRRLVDGQEFAI